MCDYVVLPLLNSSFEPGRAREVVEGFVDCLLYTSACACRYCQPEDAGGLR